MNLKKNINVLLVDDHQLIRESCKAILSLESDITIVGTAANGRQAVQLANELQPDLVIMDVTMSGMGGIEATRLIKNSLRQTKILGLSMHSNPALITAMLNAGASGYVSKTSKTSELVDAIRKVAAGMSYFSKDIADSCSIGNKPNSNALTLYSRLSGREKDILRLVADGHDTKAIAAELAISEKTVFSHRESLMKKLQIESIAGLTKFAIREGISTV
jgi:DNA-binding NarL/FixJ family response regulator